MMQTSVFRGQTTFSFILVGEKTLQYKKVVWLRETTGVTCDDDWIGEIRKSSHRQDNLNLSSKKWGGQMFEQG